MGEVKIVKLNSDQWSEYKNLRLRALKDDPDAFGPTYQEGIARSDEEWRIPLEKAEKGQEKWMLFAKLNNDLVGMISGTAMTSVEGGVKIREMFVVKEVRGQGIAKKLMANLEEELKKNPNIKALRLGVFTSQTPAINLYKSLGFETLETLTENFPSGLTHQTYFMGKDL